MAKIKNTMTVSLEEFGKKAGEYALDCSTDKPHKWAISRPKNGISLNGREYVCGENGKVKLYVDINTAMLDLAFHGYDMSAMKREGIEIVEMQENGDYYEPTVDHND